MIRLGTRGSALAVAQSELVAARLRQAGHQVELVRIVTEGDVRPPDMSPGEGVFVAALERALLDGTIDLAVHSAKDIPLESDRRLSIGAFPERADPRDALVTRAGRGSLDTLPRGATVGTDSPRRTGFVLAARPDLRVVPVHGNVDTRLKKLDSGMVDALLIAAAGLDRLGHSGRIDERIEPDRVAPAPGQGALAVQARAADHDLTAELARIDVPEVRAAVELEREVLRGAGGTCRAPVGALAHVNGASFRVLVAGVRSDGSKKRTEHLEGSGDGPRMAYEAGRRLIAAGALL